MEGWWRSNMNWNSLFSAAWQNEIPDAGVEMLNGDSKLKNWQIKIVKSINCVYIERREACNNTSNISANQI
jgi:hypothetical protein